MRFSVLPCVLSLSLSVAAVLQQPVFAQQQLAAAPTVAEASAFLDRANASLLKASVDGSHAEWLAETYINEDSEATGALLGEQGNTLQLALIAESHRFDKLDLPAAMRRQMMLLQVNAPAAPHDPALLAEETPDRRAADRDVWQGQVLPAWSSRRQVHGDRCDLEHDGDVARPEAADGALGGLAQHRRAHAAEVRAHGGAGKRGREEQGYKDTGELWRAGYDMTPAQFSAEVDRAWTQLEPLYNELHTYVRDRLIAKYGDAAKRPDGMIPAELLGQHVGAGVGQHLRHRCADRPKAEPVQAGGSAGGAAKADCGEGPGDGQGV